MTRGRRSSPSIRIKQMTTGEGGVIVTDDVGFSWVLRSLDNQGRDGNRTWMNHVRLGYNYRLDEMSAALGLTQLARLDEILDRRARVAAWAGLGAATIQSVGSVVINAYALRSREA